MAIVNHLSWQPQTNEESGDDPIHTYLLRTSACGGGCLLNFFLTLLPLLHDVVKLLLLLLRLWSLFIQHSVHSNHPLISYSPPLLSLVSISATCRPIPIFVGACNNNHNKIMVSNSVSIFSLSEASGKWAELPHPPPLNTFIIDFFVFFDRQRSSVCSAGGVLGISMSSDPLLVTHNNNDNKNVHSTTEIKYTHAQGSIEWDCC